MSKLSAVREILAFFFKHGMKAKRAKFFFALSLIPPLILLIAQIIKLLNPGANISAADIFSKALLIFYIQLLIPILSLFVGSSVINEEIDNKTLIYLTTCPIPKPSILLGKYFAYLFLSAIIINAGLLLSLLIVNISHIGHLTYLKEFLIFAGAGGLALITYSAFFTLLGTVFKKSMIFGLMFIFGWESVVQYFPGTTQKFTIIHFVKSLLPETSQQLKFLVFRLESSSTAESLIVLLLITIVTLVTAMVFFQKKEYILSDTP